MADLKTEQGITAEIKKQQAEYDKLDGRLKSARKIKADIVKLEEKLAKVQNQVSQTEKSINSEIEKRVKKVRELSTQQSASARLTSVSLKNQNQVLQLIKKQVPKGAELEGSLKEQQDTVLAIGSGMNDIAGVQNLQAQSAERMKQLKEDQDKAGIDIEKKLQDTLKAELESLRLNQLKKQQLSVLDKLTFGLASKAKDFVNAFKEDPKLAGFLALGGIVGLIAKAATTFSANIDKIGEQFGSLNNLGQDFQDQLVGASVDVTNLGFGIADVNSVVSSLSSEFGVSLDVASDLSTQILDTAKATGLSVDEATKLTGELRIIAGLSQEQSEALIEGTAQLARQAGVAPQQVLKDIAGSSETIATFTKGTGENLFEAAVAARQLGISVDSIAKAARSTLDFESSIQAELEASVLLGQQINLTRARQLALNKDLVGFQDEIKNQLSDIGDFTSLNFAAQESVAKAVGMSVNEVARLISGTEKLSVAGALAAGNFDDLSGQDALSNLSKLTGNFKELSTTFLNSLGPSLNTILEGINKFLMNEENVESLKETFKSVAETVGFLVKNLDLAIGAFVGLKAAGAVGSIIAGIRQMIKVTKNLTVMEGLKAVFANLVRGPGAAVGALVAAGAGALAVRGLVNSMKVDDFHSGPGGITHMVGPAGAFQLNPKDSVLATTNNIPVRRANDLHMTGEGGLTTNNNIDLNPLIEAANRTTQAVASLTLTADHNRIKMESDRGQIAVT